MDDAGFKNVARRLVIELIVVVALRTGATMPHGLSSAEGWRFIGRHPLLILHIVVGGLIVAEAVALSARSLRSRQAIWSVLALLGLAAVIVATIAGERTVSTQAEAAVDTMGYAWFAAVIVYSVAWYLGRRGARAAHRDMHAH